MKKGLLALALGTFFVAGEAVALIHGQALIGQRNLNVKDGSKFSGQELKFAVHLDPIPLVPIGFGAYLSTTDFGKKDSVTGFTGNEIGLEVTAWFPMELLSLKPYARLGYSFMGSYKVERELAEATYNPSGVRMGAGVKWSPLPLMSVLFEVEKTNIELKFDKASGAGAALLTDSNLKTDSLGFLVGLEVGI